MEKKYSNEAVLKMIKNHVNEMKLCSKYLDACKRVGDKQGEKDFKRLVTEHAQASYRYSMMITYWYACNLNVSTPKCLEVK